MAISYTHFKIDGTRGITFYDKNKIVDIMPISQVVRKFLDKNRDYEYLPMTEDEEYKYCKGQKES